MPTVKQRIEQLYDELNNDDLTPSQRKCIHERIADLENRDILEEI